MFKPGDSWYIITSFSKQAITMSDEQVAGATTGQNDESVLLDPSTAMARRIEQKLRTGMNVEYFVSRVFALPG